VEVTGWILIGFDWGDCEWYQEGRNEREDCLRQQQQQVRLPVSSRCAGIDAIYIIIVHPRAVFREIEGSE